MDAPTGRIDIVDIAVYTLGKQSRERERILMSPGGGDVHIAEVEVKGASLDL